MIKMHMKVCVRTWLLVGMAILIAASPALSEAKGKKNKNKGNSWATASSVDTQDGFRPQGRPFLELWSHIDTIEEDLDALVGRVDTMEEQIAANMDAIAALQAQTADLQAQIDENSGDIAALQEQVDQNADLISALQAEIDSIQTILDQKQDILDGSCPPDQFLVEIFPDGAIVCESASAGNLVRTLVQDILTLDAFEDQTGVLPCPVGSIAVDASYSVPPDVKVNTLTTAAGTEGEIGVVNTGGVDDQDVIFSVSCISVE